MNKSIIKILGLILSVLILVGAGVFIKWQVDKNQIVPEAAKVVPATGLITIAQLQENKTNNSCWITVKKKVYNLTKYVDKHPGGKELFNGCGKEIDSLFPAHPGGRFDSEKNLNLILPYYIGELQS